MFSRNMMTNSQRSSVLETYDEAQRYFMGEGQLNNALARLVADLQEHDIDYLVIGAIALMAYGYARFTEDIDLMIAQVIYETGQRVIESSFAHEVTLRFGIRFQNRAGLTVRHHVTRKYRLH